MLPDSISEGVIFQNFLGGMPPDPPRFGMLRMHVCFAHSLYVVYKDNCLHELCPPPFQNPGSTPAMVVETDEESLRKFNGIIKLDIRLLGHGDVMMFVTIMFT